MLKRFLFKKIIKNYFKNKNLNLLLSYYQFTFIYFSFLNIFNKDNLTEEIKKNVIYVKKENIKIVLVKHLANNVILVHLQVLKEL